MRLLLVIIAITAARCSEYDNLGQKKRGVTKGSSTNIISTGAQKQDYTYSIYSQNPSSQNSQTVSGSVGSSYQPQVPNSFYPNQASSQYYSPGTESPQTNTQTNPSQSFVPINFVPNPGIQTKYQVPTKQGVFAVVQPPYNFQSPVVHYPQFSANPQQLSVSPLQHILGNSYLGHPSFLFPTTQQLHSNLLYNSNPSSNQAKYNIQFLPPVPSNYDTIPPSSSKEQNEVGSHSDYSISADSTSSYKNGYSSGNS